MNKKKIIMMLCALWGVYFVLLALLITCLVFSIGEQLLRFFTIIIALFYLPIAATVYGAKSYAYSKESNNSLKLFLYSAIIIYVIAYIFCGNVDLFRSDSIPNLSLENIQAHIYVLLVLPFWVEILISSWLIMFSRRLKKTDPREGTSPRKPESEQEPTDQQE